MILGKDTQTSLFVRRIRKLFLKPEERYSLTTAARMLGITVKELRAWIDAGEMEAEGCPGGDVGSERLFDGGLRPDVQRRSRNCFD